MSFSTSGPVSSLCPSYIRFSMTVLVENSVTGSVLDSHAAGLS
jgi:hypothetical protein